MERREKARRTDDASLGAHPLHVAINREKHLIKLRGDLTGSYDAKINLSTELIKAAGEPKWTIDADEIRFDEGGVQAWAEYVQHLLVNSELKYLPSALAAVLRFDGQIVYKHERSTFEES
jgi:hypothetical protein